MISWNNLSSLDQLEEINKDSFHSVQAIFKHSTSCPISHMAKSRVESTWNLDEIKPFYLDLLAHRDVSNRIAEKWEVQHESPQIILIKNGEAIFNESHLDINLESISRYLKTHA